ncbi:RecE-like exonuclease [Microbacterium phage Nicole72]|uniref:RecE-like exonuclease n=1 Tax=Microbacterium phage Nicole72 TaxID=3062838 RepID=A0ACD4UHT1_9CAUD|nr:RecE-like exonuclease [Microbacterium phage Nicole72]
MTPTLTSEMPVRGALYDKSRPETREPWMAQRRGGLTATDIRDWPVPSQRRRIMTEKVTGEDTRDGSFRVAGSQYTLDDYAHHGSVREDSIAEWIEATFGIQPSKHVYAHPANDRWLATPDGMYVEPFSAGYAPGTEDAVISEVKTHGTSLQPGPLDANRVLRFVDPQSAFSKERYYRQVQWQMLVMNARRTLFVWEVRSKERDHEAGIWVPEGAPEWCWIERDDEFIARLVDEADDALAQIDAAVIASTLGELPPASDVPAEHALLIAEYLRALDAEKVAAASKVKAWDALKAIYLADDMPDDSIDAGFARLTTSTSQGSKKVIDTAGMEAKAPALVKRYRDLEARFTKVVPNPTRGMKITAQTVTESA